jgi:hypothetical protein
MTKELLAAMVKEPREEPWASSSENAIRALVELEPGRRTPRGIAYTIRALECRQSICFVETASDMESFDIEFLYFERTNRLKAGYALFSTETRQDGTRVHVTLLPVVRTARTTIER